MSETIFLLVLAITIGILFYKLGRLNTIQAQLNKQVQAQEIQNKRIDDLYKIIARLTGYKNE